MADGGGPEAIIARLPEMLARYGVTDLAVTGGVAVGVWTEPRQTRDIDVCAVVPAESVTRLLARFDGVTGGLGDVPDVLRLSIGPWDVDVFPAKEPYDHECLARARSTDMGGTPVRVVSPEDLLIHKLVKIRSDRRRLLQDATDIRAVLTTLGASLDHAYLAKWLPAAEAKLLADAPALADDELVRRLAGGTPVAG